VYKFVEHPELGRLFSQKLPTRHFNSDYVDMVGQMMEGVPPTDLWEKLEAVG